MSKFIENTIQTIREKTLFNNIVLVDGQPGCGKTLFSAIISAMERVELLQYSPILENICALYHLNKLTKDGAIAMLQIEFDLILYETMMSRNTNFRPSDLSSAFKSAKVWTYLRRLFEKGDELVPGRINNVRPILHFATHNLLGFSNIIFQSVSEKLTFLEIVRHPLYMLIQQSLNHENWTSNEDNSRQFHLYIKGENKNIPYYVHNWDIDYNSLNSVEKAIYEIDFMTKKTESFKNNYPTKNLLTIPFESFVLDPWPYMEKIKIQLGSKITNTTKKVMKKQRVPRIKISDGIPLQIYKRCGWEPPMKNQTETQELEKRRQFAIDNGASKIALDVLDKLSEEYEKNYYCFDRF